MSEIGMGTLYDMNKIAIVKLPALSNKKFQKKMKEIKDFFLKNNDKYFMLLNRETYNFTLFNLGDKNDIAISLTIADLEECLCNRGKVVSIEVDSTSNYEIWVINEDNKALVYYLFPYDLGVIEHGMEVS